MVLKSIKQLNNFSFMEIINSKNQSMFSIVYQLPPRQIFLIDAVGALITSSILGLLLPQINDLFLLDKQIFYLLAAYVVVLFFYSSSVYFLQPSEWINLLRIIALANAAYCFFTLAIIFFISPTISTLGIVYFIGEGCIILAIAYVEWTYARRNKDMEFSI